MARIELRDATIYLRDGLSGSATVNEAAVASGDTDIGIDAIVLNTEDTDLVPVGARFTIAGETGSPVHTVTARSPSTSGPTTNIVFTPALEAGVVDDAIITFQSQQLEIKIGEGNLTWTVNREYEYLLDRGDLDTVREGSQQPLNVSIDSVYEHISTGTSEEISVYDALNGVGSASEWVSSSSDLCEPYAVDVVVEHETPCGSAQDETTILPDYRYESLEANLSDATITTSGRCNTVLPSVTRS